MKNSYSLIMIMLLISISYGFAQDKTGWKVISTGDNVSSVCFTDSQNGWMTYQNSTIPQAKFTTDGGHSWLVNDSLDGYPINRISFTDKNNGMGIALSFPKYNRFYKTSDGGKNWQVLKISDSVSNLNITSMCFIDKNYGWITAYNYLPGYVLKTTNGGNNWQIVDISKTLKYKLLCISFSDKNVGFAGDENGNIVVSTDGGNSWVVARKSLNRLKISSICSVENNTWACNDSGIIFRTLDGGIVWDTLNLGLHQPVNDIKFINKEIGWIVGGSVGKQNFIYRTTDGGNNWVKQTPEVILPRLNSISFVSWDTAWIGGDGVILNTSTGGSTPYAFKTEIKGPGIICGNDDIVLSAEPYSDSLFYYWSTGQRTKNISVNKEGTYSVSVKSMDGGSGTAEITVKKADKPEFEIKGENDICFGNNTVLSADKDFTSYLWSTGDTTKSIVASETGKYILFATNEYGCKSSRIFNLNVIKTGMSIEDSIDVDFGDVHVFDSLTITKTIHNKGLSPLDLSIHSEIFTGNFSDLNVTLSKSQDDEIYPGDSLVIYLKYNPRTDMILKGILDILVKKPCSGYCQFKIKGQGVITGISDHASNDEAGINLYPNPATTTAEIHLCGHIDRNTTVSIFSIYGSKLDTFENFYSNQDNKIALNLENYTPGIYQVVLQSGSGHISLPLVVIK